MIESKHKPGHPEFLKEARRLGLTGNEYVQKLREKDILPDPTDVNRKEIERYIRNRKYKNADTSISKIESNDKTHFCDYCINKKGLHNINVKIISVMNDVPVDKIYSIPSSCGAYVIIDDSRQMYVGSSKNVLKRIYEHLSYFRSIKLVSFYETKNTIDARILEYYIIRELKPELNREFLEE